MEVRTARQAVLLARRLGRRKARDAEQRFVVEGITFVEEALQSESAVDCLVYTSSCAETPQGAGAAGPCPGAGGARLSVRGAPL